MCEVDVMSLAYRPISWAIFHPDFTGVLTVVLSLVSFPAPDIHDS